MTLEGEIVILQEHLATCDRLESGLFRVRTRIEPIVPMGAERMLSLPDDEHVTERLMPRDVAYRAVSLGILEDGKAWADAVRVRNELAHEYPLRPDKQAEQVNKAWEKSDTLFQTASAIRNFVERERLLHGDL